MRDQNDTQSRREFIARGLKAFAYTAPVVAILASEAALAAPDDAKGKMGGGKMGHGKMGGGKHGGGKMGHGKMGHGKMGHGKMAGGKTGA